MEQKVVIMLRTFIFVTTFLFFYFASFSISDFKLLSWNLGLKTAFAQTSEKKEPQKAPNVSPRPQNVNFETLRLIERIETKTKELKKREEAVKLKEQQLKDLEKKVKKDLKQIENAINQGQVLLGISEDLNQENLINLVKIYSSMPPANAALLIGALDGRIAIPIISKMKSKIAAKILSQMDPKAVKVISEKLVNPAKYKEPTR
jgi:flagellar motility protein MotE (MotC chaperone)